MRVRVCEYLPVCACVIVASTDGNIRVCLLRCVSARVTVRVSESVHTYVNVCVYVCADMCMYTCIYACMRALKNSRCVRTARRQLVTAAVRWTHHGSTRSQRVCIHRR